MNKLDEEETVLVDAFDTSGDLSDLQVRAPQEGVPYQTLIASIVHKYVTGRLAEKTEVVAVFNAGRASKRSMPSAN